MKKDPMLNPQGRVIANVDKVKQQQIMLTADDMEFTWESMKY